MNKRGQADEIMKIGGAILSILFMILFFSAMIPVFNSLSGQDTKQAEINELNNKLGELQQEIANKRIEISELSSLLDSVNFTLGEKDAIISNLSGQLTDKENRISELSRELTNYREKEYLLTINNNYYNILSYVERIENKFYTINLAIGLISLTLTGIVIKLFGLDITIKLFFKKIWKKKELPKLE